MESNPAFHQLGRFIYRFQSVEEQIEGLIFLMVDADEVMVKMLLNELDFSGKLKAVDVMFARYIDLRKLCSNYKKSFHREINKLVNLSKSRNALVHSQYSQYTDVDGKTGLILTDFRLKPSKGNLEENEIEVMDGSLDNEIEEIDSAIINLNDYRLKIISWQYPDLQD